MSVLHGHPKEAWAEFTLYISDDIIEFVRDTLWGSVRIINVAGTNLMTPSEKKEILCKLSQLSVMIETAHWWARRTDDVFSAHLEWVDAQISTISASYQIRAEAGGSALRDLKGVSALLDSVREAMTYIRSQAEEFRSRSGDIRHREGVHGHRKGDTEVEKSGSVQPNLRSKRGELHRSRGVQGHDEGDSMDVEKSVLVRCVMKSDQL